MELNVQIQPGNQHTSLNTADSAANQRISILFNVLCTPGGCAEHEAQSHRVAVAESARLKQDQRRRRRR